MLSGHQPLFRSRLILCEILDSILQTGDGVGRDVVAQAIGERRQASEGRVLLRCVPQQRRIRLEGFSGGVCRDTFLDRGDLVLVEIFASGDPLGAIGADEASECGPCVIRP